MTEGRRYIIYTTAGVFRCDKAPSPKWTATHWPDPVRELGVTLVDDRSGSRFTGYLRFDQIVTIRDTEEKL